MLPRRYLTLLFILIKSIQLLFLRNLGNSFQGILVTISNFGIALVNKSDHYIIQLTKTPKVWSLCHHSCANYPGISVGKQNAMWYFHNRECSSKHRTLKGNFFLTYLMTIWILSNLQVLKEDLGCNDLAIQIHCVLAHQELSWIMLQ